MMAMHQHQESYQETFSVTVDGQPVLFGQIVAEKAQIENDSSESSETTPINTPEPSSDFAKASSDRSSSTPKPPEKDEICRKKICCGKYWCSLRTALVVTCITTAGGIITTLIGAATAIYIANMASN